MILGNSGVGLSGRELPAGYQLVGLETLDPASQDLYIDEMRTLLGGLYDATLETYLDKVRAQEDRRAEVVLDASSRCCGTLIYKSDLVREAYWDMSNGDDIKVYDAFELKTLALFHPEQDGGQGIGAHLLERAEQLAVDKEARGIVLTVAKKEPLEFFWAHGYALELTRRKYNRNGIKEDAGYVMYKALRDGGIDKRGRWFS